MDGDVAADVVDAEAAIVRLNTEASALADTEAMARFLLRAESVASSRIEGLEVDGLAATRYRGPATGKNAQAGLNLWVATFAGACTRAVNDAASFEMRVEQIEREWRALLGRIRSGSATGLLLRSLVGASVLTVGSAAGLIGRSFPQTSQAIERLVLAAVLSQVKAGKRNRFFEGPAIISAFTDLERQLASPSGDTRSSRPVRPVPPSRRPTPLFSLAR